VKPPPTPSEPATLRTFDEFEWAEEIEADDLVEEEPWPRFEDSGRRS